VKGVSHLAWIDESKRDSKVGDDGWHGEGGEGAVKFQIEDRG
jgi:hypothetical protein